MGNLQEPTILLAGVVPPPVHGQSLATKALFDSDLPGMRKRIIEIRSSQNLTEVGKFSLTKALSLFPLIWRTWKECLRYRPTTLYYTAGSGAWIPFIRDFAFLGLCRPFFRRTVIHYHSGDLVEFLERSQLRNLAGQFIYGRGAWTISLGQGCPAPNYPQNRIFEVPNGIAAPSDLGEPMPQEPFRILFLGNLYEDKGIFDLLEACKILASQTSRPISVSLVGNYPDEETRTKVTETIKSLPSGIHCEPPAPAFGDKKWKQLRSHDALVFPSYYRRENLPLVVIEAMAASLPVVSTRWRGIPSLIEDGQTGFLTPISDPTAIAGALLQLSNSPGLATQLGRNARRKYEASFTLEHFLLNMKTILQEASGLGSQ